MPRAEPAETRARLLRTAANLIWERSFQAAGVDELCRRARAKKGSFYHFFPSKSDLAIAAIECSWAETQRTIFEPAFAADSHGLTQLRTLVDRVYEFQVQVAAEKGAFLGCPFGNLAQEMALQDERIRETLSRIFSAHYDYLAAALERAVQQGEIPPGDNRRRARNLFALLEGALLLAKVANDPQVFRDAMSAVEMVAAA